MAVLGGSDLGDGLAVRNFRSEELDLYAIFIDETGLDNVDVLLAVSGEDGLAEFFRIFNHDRRVL